MELILKGDIKEIADLVLTLQGQRHQEEITDIFGNKYCPTTVIQKAVRQSTEKRKSAYESADD